MSWKGKFPVGWSSYIRKSEEDNTGLLRMFDKKASVLAQGGYIRKEDKGTLKTYRYIWRNNKDGRWIPSDIGFKLKKGSVVMAIRATIMRDFVTNPMSGSLTLNFVSSDSATWVGLAYTWVKTAGTQFIVSAGLPLTLNEDFYLYCNAHPFNQSIPDNGDGYVLIELDVFEPVNN